MVEGAAAVVLEHGPEGLDAPGVGVDANAFASQVAGPARVCGAGHCWVGLVRVHGHVWADAQRRSRGAVLSGIEQAAPLRPSLRGP